MNVVKPKVIWMEKRCYRCFGDMPELKNDDASPPHVANSKLEEDNNDDLDTHFVDVKIEHDEKFVYKHSFSVPSAYRGIIIGPKGETAKRLEKDTKTAIRIPRPNTIGDIVITGSCLDAIVAARHKIDVRVESSRMKVRPTHFISIPMIDETIASNYENLKNKVLNETGKDSRGVKETIFQKPEKMHLTLGLLIFIDDDEIKAGVEALEECNEKIIKPIMEKHGPIKIKAQGLGCFENNPAKIPVLYAKVSSENNALQELADKTSEFFMEKGMLKKERDNVNLHMTLMNISYAVDKSLPYYKRVEKFDATNIMEAHKDHLFGEILLNTIQICSFTGPKTADGYYEIISKITV